MFDRTCHQEQCRDPHPARRRGRLPARLDLRSRKELRFRMLAAGCRSGTGRVRLGGMSESQRSPLSLNALLAAVEAAPPVAAADVLAAALAEAIGAREVS